MEKYTLLLGLCFLLCTSVHGYVEYDNDSGGIQLVNDSSIADAVHSPPINETHEDLNLDTDVILTTTALHSILEHIADLLLSISSQLSAGDKMSSLNLSALFGESNLKKGFRPIKFIKKPQKPKKPHSSSKPEKFVLPDVNIDIDADIIVPISSSASDKSQQDQTDNF